MSRLILNGNIDSNLGKYLPTPYVEKITLNSDSSESVIAASNPGGFGTSDNNSNVESYIIRAGLTAQIKDDIQLYDYSTPSSITPEESIVKYLKEYNYYLMTFYVNSSNLEYVIENDPNDERLFDPDGVYNYRLPLKYYDQIINGEINPFDIIRQKDNLNFETSLGSADTEPVFEINYYQFTDTDSSAPAYINFATSTESFDNQGNKFLTFPMSLIDNLPGRSSKWRNTGEFRYLIFSSPFDYSANPSAVSQNLENVELFNLQISDISYEIVFNNGVLGNPDNSAYFDVNGEIYQDPEPLMSFNGQAYKIKNITYDQVVQNFTDLLSDFNVFYNRKSGYQQLKDMIDQINVILARKDDPGILVRLFRLMKAFPDKTPTKPIGQLYKRFRQRINSTNAAIKNDQPLQRKVIADSKIVDARDAPEPDPLENIFIEGTTFFSADLYSVSQGYNRTDTQQKFIQDGLRYSFTNEELEAENFDIIFGSLFFDYEKALRRTSNISRVFNVGRLEALNIPVPWKSFNTKVAYYSKKYIAAEAGEGGEDVPLTLSNIGCIFDEDRSYPLSKYIYLKETNYSGVSDEIKSLFYTPTSIRNYIDSNRGLGASDAKVATPFTPPPRDDGEEPTVLSDANQGFMSSLVFRQFLDPSNTDNYGINRSQIEKYRFMMFQLLDYRLGGASMFDDYFMVVIVEDSTKSQIQSLINNLKDALSLIQGYYNTALELCSFNEDTQRFNDFFRDAVTAKYEDNPASAPWYYVPVVYCMHLDLVNNQFKGDIDEILKTAANISMQINPTDGNPEALGNFVTGLEKFINDFYDDGTEIKSLLDEMSATRTVFYVEKLSESFGEGYSSRGSRIAGMAERTEAEEVESVNAYTSVAQAHRLYTAEAETAGTGTDTDDTPGSGVGGVGAGGGAVGVDVGGFTQGAIDEANYVSSWRQQQRDNEAAAQGAIDRIFGGVDL